LTPIISSNSTTRADGIRSG